MSVEEGSKVKVQYTGRFPDGTVFDKSPENNPLAFTVGAGSIIPGFEKAVEGMRLNEEKQVTIGAQDAYGQRDEELIKEFPKSSFPADFVPQKGMVISLKNQESGVIMATIIDVLQDSVMVDLNHPLAGKDLIFDIKIVSIE
ncbi:MAG: peptidylprolyl isomerase [Candidatus Omnitrophota bacterium]|nr:MAG: peptidylprolyl isomerase [Candidatus Omnitrophota bacterium]